MTKVFDILHKMHDPVEGASGPVLDSEDVAGMVSRIDTDGDGLVTSAEFVAARPEHVTEQDAAQLFAQFDSDNAGVLSLDRLTASLQAVGTAGPDDTAALSALGPDVGAGVNRDEFLASMQQPETPDDAVKSLLRLLGGKDAPQA